MFLNPVEYGRKAEEVLWRKVFYQIIQMLKHNKRLKVSVCQEQGGWGGGSVVPSDHPEPQRQETLGNPKEEQAGEGAFRPSDVQTHPGVQTQRKTQVCHGFR